jgi:ribulose-5-phosphate 4-epimerase/fuculose-1-phosphate aldolase
MLVTTLEQGADLAAALGRNNVALMRGHGFAAAARSLQEVVWLAVNLPKNARILTTATLLGGGVKSLTPAEVEKSALDPKHSAFQRGWEYWLHRAGVRSAST